MDAVISIDQLLIEICDLYINAKKAYFRTDKDGRALVVIIDYNNNCISHITLRTAYYCYYHQICLIGVPIIKHKDGDTNNFSKDNLVLLHHKMFCRKLKGSFDGVITSAGQAIASNHLNVVKAHGPYLFRNSIRYDIYFHNKKRTSFPMQKVLYEYYHNVCLLPGVIAYFINNDSDDLSVDNLGITDRKGWAVIRRSRSRKPRQKQRRRSIRKHSLINVRNLLMMVFLMS